MLKTLYLIFFFIFTECCQSQDILYNSEKFKIKCNSVEQGDFSAVSENSYLLRSNFPGVSEGGIDRIITFKFAINGEDNERPSGLDHTIYLRPINGLHVTPVFEFGKPDPEGSSQPQGADVYLGEKIEVLFRVDFRKILRSFDEYGYYEIFTGEKIRKEDFNGLYIAGGTHPLIWDFADLKNNNSLKMKDEDGDGIYELNLVFNNKSQKKTHNGFTIREIKSDLSKYPSYKSGFTIVEALYNMSLEEMMMNIRDDGAFMAGAKWTGVWTRDISYSILLSLAAIETDACKVSLYAKVKDGMIIQDTGTGGSWPVSTDRMVWALAAWEVYNVTGDENWLKEAYEIIRKSVESDLPNIYDPQTKLVRGESSFLDWREQTYPKWMDPKDIYSSINLGTNAVHYRTLIILSQMAKLLGKKPDKYMQIADNIRDGINKYLWLDNKNYYSQYLYGRVNLLPSAKSEALGSALCVLFDIAGEQQSKNLISNYPVTEFGIPTIFPQIPDIPPYHNNSVWPFVSAYWTWASVKADNCTAVEHGLASIYRSSAIFLTNKENFVAETGDYHGTEINSDRQLWSVAGNIASVFRIFIGLNFTQSGIYFSPLIPEAYSGKHTLTNFKYRGSILDITVEGFGNKISEMKLDGHLLRNNFIPSEIFGKHDICIKLSNEITKSHVNFNNNVFSPRTPEIKLEGSKITWDRIPGTTYRVYKNGNMISSSDNNYHIIMDNENLNEYQILAIDKSGNESFLSEPLLMVNEESVQIINSNTEFAKVSDSVNTTLNFELTIQFPGKYIIDVNYANGNGPINTDNKCAIRTLCINGKEKFPIIMPQRGLNDWENWGFCNAVVADLKEGKNSLSLIYEEDDKNMNGKINSALIKYLRVILKTKTKVI